MDNELPSILSLCDLSGVMVDPWLNSGYECWIVDMQHPKGETRDGLLVRVGADVRTWLPPIRRWWCAFAFPPCTDTAVSGARWFQSKGLRALAEAIDTFGASVNICEWTKAKWMAENPVSVISSHYRKPDYTFDPCDYGDDYLKKTCLWTGGGFVMPEKKRVEPTNPHKIHRMPPSSNRGMMRSLTPRGFAKAVYESNKWPGETCN